MTRIIALTGPAGAGKDLCTEIMTSQMLCRDPDVRIRSLSFAAPIKEAVAAILGCTPECFDDREFKEGSLKESHDLDTSPRKMMQLLGDDFARQMIDQAIWLKAAKARYENAQISGADFMFITDLRYENEHKWVLESGGVVIYIDRMDAAPVASHVSEAGLSRPPCFVIDNNGPIDTLRLECLEMVRLLQPQKPQRLSIDDCSPAEWNRATSRLI
jgi:hypothetical protein